MKGLLTVHFLSPDTPDQQTGPQKNDPQTDTFQDHFASLDQMLLMIIEVVQSAFQGLVRARCFDLDQAEKGHGHAKAQGLGANPVRLDHIARQEG